ncbi:MAG: hypothetical protein AAFZ92_04010 [Pseudomonadota bacterium]
MIGLLILLLIVVALIPVAGYFARVYIEQNDEWLLQQQQQAEHLNGHKGAGLRVKQLQPTILTFPSSHTKKSASKQMNAQVIVLTEIRRQIKK